MSIYDSLMNINFFYSSYDSYDIIYVDKINQINIIFSPVRIADDMMSLAARLRLSSPAFSSTNLAIEFCKLLQRK